MITVVGSANMDVIARVPRLPERGETVLGTNLARAPGGKGANQAVAAARAGGEVVFVGRVGDDTNGAGLTQSLRLAGVSVDYLTIDPRAPTGTALITVDDHGENSIVVIPGANSHVSFDDLERAQAAIEASGLVALQLEIPLETVVRAAQLAASAYRRVLLNASPARILDQSLLELVDILVVNEQEVAMVSGMGSPVDPAAAARFVLDCGTKTVVVTLGERGAVIVTPEQEVDIPAFEVEALDSTGAGDAFAGNLATALDRGKTLEDAVRFASAAAALSVQVEGAQPSMPPLERTERFLQEVTAP